MTAAPQSREAAAVLPAAVLPAARTWADVDLGRVAGNARALQNLEPGAGLMAIVKADAYGHGAVPVARACATSRAGVAHFGVACLTEANELRGAGVRAELYTLSPFLPDEAEALVRADVTPFVSSVEQLFALADAGGRAPLPARCFLKVDTGMGRGGCLPDEAHELWSLAHILSDGLRVTGIATHFSDADEPDRDPTERQVQAFDAFLRYPPRASCVPDDGRGNTGLWLSSANSPGALRFADPDAASVPFPVRGVLVRAGLALYGIEPFAGAFADHPEIRPALSWRARVVLVRDLPTGATIGYGRTCTLTRPSRIATLAAGYADGLSRRLSNVGHVLLHGQRVPLVGRVSMDQCQADVTDVPGVQTGDVATIIGRDGAERQSVLDLARLLDTTPHEPTCALSRRVVRHYHNSGGDE